MTSDTPLQPDHEARLSCAVAQVLATNFLAEVVRVSSAETAGINRRTARKWLSASSTGVRGSRGPQLASCAHPQHPARGRAQVLCDRLPQSHCGSLRGARGQDQAPADRQRPGLRSRAFNQTCQALGTKPRHRAR